MLRPFDALIDHHRKETTQIDGPRCPMYPSCSAYAKKAVREHGLVGFWMFLDRIVYRERGKLYRKYFLAPQEFAQESSIARSRPLRYYDPVEDSLPVFSTRSPSFLKENFTRSASQFAGR